MSDSTRPAVTGAPPAPTSAPATVAPSQDAAATASAIQHAPPADDGLTGEQTHLSATERSQASPPPDQSDLGAILSWDPFGPPPPAGTPPAVPDAPPHPSAASAPAAAPSGPAPTPPGPGPAVPPSTVPAAATPPPAPPVAAPPDPRDQQIAQLTRDLNLLRTTMEGVTRALPAAASPAAAPQQAQEDYMFPETDYAIQLHDNMVAGLASEDPAVRKANMEALVRGVAKIVHKEVVTAYRKDLDRQIVPRVQRTLAAQREQEAIRSDYFGTYPHHQQFSSLVAQVTQQVFAETGAQGWNADVRDRIGARVQSFIQAAVGGTAPLPATAMVPPVAHGAPSVAPAAGPVPTPSASSAPKPPHVFGGAASPAMAPVPPGGEPPNSPGSIYSTLFT